MDQLLNGKLLLCERQADLCLDEGNIEAGVAGRPCGCGKEPVCRPGPVDCAQAHGTWFTATVNLTPGKLEVACRTARCSYSNNFSMCRGIKSCRDLIHPCRDDLSLFHHQRSKGSASALHILDRQL